jgi:hypothetical protein
MNQEASELIEQELSHAGFSSDDKQRLSKLEECRITPLKNLPPVEFLFRLHGKPCFARGELVGLSGKAKSGKTFVCSILMALCFRNEVLSVQRIEPRKLHVLWYDTEQSDESTKDILCHRILKMIGDSNSRVQDSGSTDSQLSTLNSPLGSAALHSKELSDLFDIFNVRRNPVSERLTDLEVLIRHTKPDLVILDGIRDLVTDINDGVVAQNVVERLMHLASEHHCCIVCVLHQNKSVEDRNLRGWIGTELKNKAFEVYECAKSSGRIFTWSQTDTRKYDIAEGLSFAVNEDGIPYRCTEKQLLEAQFEEQRKAVAKMEKSGRTGKPYADLNPKYAHKEGRKHIFDVKLLFTDIMQPGKIYDEEALRTEIYAKTNAVKDKIHNEILRQAVTEKVILCCTNPFGKKEYLLPAPEPSTEAVDQELPF